MDALLTERGCSYNQLVCKVAIIETLEGLSPFLLSHEELDRMFWCGRCDKFKREGNDIDYQHDRQSYNPNAINTENIKDVDDLIRVVEIALFRNLIKIEGMDMERGNPDTRLYRRRLRDRARKEAEEKREILESWVANLDKE